MKSFFLQTSQNDPAPSGLLRSFLLRATPQKVLQQLKRFITLSSLQPHVSKQHSFDVDIILYVHNEVTELRHCLHSILEHTPLYSHRIIFIDDGSDTETRKFLERFSIEHACLLLSHDTKLGVAAAMATGATFASAPYLTFFSSPLRVSEGWLDTMRECFLRHPETGLVGPVSNTPGSQNVYTMSHDCQAQNPQEPRTAISLSEFAGRVRKITCHLFPTTVFLDAPCLMMRRNILENIGQFDTSYVPTRYWKHDFCLRVRNAGFSIRIADGCFVYTKALSYEDAAYQEKEYVDRVHAPETCEALQHHLASRDAVTRTCAYVSVAAHHTASFSESFSRVYPKSPFSLLWIQPHLGIVGGIRRVIEMTNYLYRCGVQVTVATPDGIKPDWLPMFAPVKALQEIDNEHFDMGMISDPDMASAFQNISCDKRIAYHLGAYMVYRNNDESLRLYYNQLSIDHHIANSHWTAEHVAKHCGVKVEKIFPGGVDKRLFHPISQTIQADVVCYGSSRVHKGTKDIEHACRSLNLQLLKLAGQHVKQTELASLICSGKIFVSACWHEGFNLCALEAMACGIPVVLTDDGGSREYAVDRENCLMVPPKDVHALGHAIQEMLRDHALRQSCIENGIRTAWCFDWRKISLDFLDFLESVQKRKDDVIESATSMEA